MAKEDDVLIQLATRIPKGLHREIKLYCVQTGISVMEFVASALEEKLRKASGRTGRRSAARWARRRASGQTAHRRRWADPRENLTPEAAGVDLERFTDAREGEHVGVGIAQEPGQRFTFQCPGAPARRVGVLQQRADAVF